MPVFSKAPLSLRWITGCHTIHPAINWLLPQCYWLYIVPKFFPQSCCITGVCHYAKFHLKLCYRWLIMFDRLIANETLTKIILKEDITRFVVSKIWEVKYTRKKLITLFNQNRCCWWGLHSPGSLKSDYCITLDHGNLVKVYIFRNYMWKFIGFENWIENWVFSFLERKFSMYLIWKNN